MPFEPPAEFNIADHFLSARIREGRGARNAVRTDERDWTYDDILALANRTGHMLRNAGVRPEERVILALPDGPEFVAALFGVFKIGAVAVMVNPDQKPDALRSVLEYTRAYAAIVHHDTAAPFLAAVEGTRFCERILVAGEPRHEAALAAAPAVLDTFPTHRDDGVLWLFSGGTTGVPKAVVQTHTSYANTAECYGRGVLGMTESDITIAVPKLFFGYATGSNLLFPFLAGASTVLFPEAATAEVLFGKIGRFRPTILVAVPKMIHLMVEHPAAAGQDLSSLRLATSAGEALPVDLHHRWDDRFGVELLDGLGTAEMWHIFLSNRPGDVRPGTLGTAVPGFDVRVCDDEGRQLPDGEVGVLWVRGNSRAIGYWQRMEETRQAFRGEWYVSGDMVVRDPDGAFTYCGRTDDMLKVSGKWLSPGEVENCLLRHPGIREAAVVGVADGTGLTKPWAFVVAAGAADAADTAAGNRTSDLAGELQAFVRESLDPNKSPREVVFLGSLPRTHLGKVDRGELRRRAAEGSPEAGRK